MFISNKRGQNTLEYILILTAIVGFLLYAAVAIVKPKVNQAFSDVAASIEHTATVVAPQ